MILVQIFVIANFKSKYFVFLSLKISLLTLAFVKKIKKGRVIILNFNAVCDLLKIK